MGYATLAQANLAAGDIAAAHQASEAAWQHLSVAQPELATAQRGFNATEVALANGDLAAARALADERRFSGRRMASGDGSTRAFPSRDRRG